MRYQKFIFGFILFSVLIHSKLSYAETAQVPQISQMVSSLNQIAGNVNNIGPQTIVPGQANHPVIKVALDAIRNPAVVEQIRALEFSMAREVRVLVAEGSSSQSKQLAAERLVRNQGKLARLMDARANLVKALNQSLRSKVAQANGVNAYTSRQGPWFQTTLQIIKEARTNLSRSRASSRSGNFTSRLAKNVSVQLSNIAPKVRGQFRSSPAAVRPTGPDIPNVIITPPPTNYVDP